MKKSVVRRIRQRGLLSSAKVIFNRGLSIFFRIVVNPGRKLFFSLRGIRAEEYKNPTAVELQSIEGDIRTLNISVADYRIDLQEFLSFKAFIDFPPDYCGGEAGGVYQEKLLEHFVAWNFLNLSNGRRYLDVAGASSPWASLLNERGVEAYCIDLRVPNKFARNSWYIKGDATKTNFADDFFDAASAQCAFEMFEDDSDIRLLSEVHRILKPGGRLVISPLYMHTHSCYYQTPDFWKKAHGDAGAKAYIRRDCWGIPFSRKYSAKTLQSRVIQNALHVGLNPIIHALRNKLEIAGNIYLHFVLVLDKPSL